MKRALLIGAGTIAGTAAVLGYHPGSWFGTAAPAAATPLTAAASTDSTTTDGTTTDSTSASTATGADTSTGTTTGTQATTASSKRKTYTGDAAQTRFGAVQVQIVVKNGKVVSAQGGQNATDGHSAQIAAYAIPQLEQQAVAAQSANIQGVSGASYTSYGFAQSLQSALQQAGLA